MSWEGGGGGHYSCAEATRNLTLCRNTQLLLLLMLHLHASSSEYEIKMELYVPSFLLSLLKTVIFSNKPKLTTLFPDLGFETTSDRNHATIRTISDRLPRLNHVSAGLETCSAIFHLINEKKTFNLNRPYAISTYLFISCN